MHKAPKPVLGRSQREYEELLRTDLLKRYWSVVRWSGMSLVFTFVLAGVISYMLHVGLIGGHWFRWAILAAGGAPFLTGIVLGAKTQSLRLLISTGRSTLQQGETSHEPPRAAQVFLFVFSKRNHEHIIGDLEEEYRTTSKRFPRLWYWSQVIALVANYWWATLRRRARFDVVLKMIRK